MERIRGHRIAGPVGARATGERHYWAAASAVIGIGTSLWGGLSAPSGKLPTAVRAQMAEEQRRSDEAYNMAQMLLPYQLDSAGLIPIYTNGKITGVQKKPLTKNQVMEEEIRTAADEKVLKGLKGELDIDPAAKRSMDEQDAQRTEYLMRTQGPDYKTSTAGAQQIQRGQESRNVQESSIRRGEMTAADAISNSQRQQQNFEMQYQMNAMRGAPAGMFAAGDAARDPYMLGMMDRSYGIGMGRASGLADIGSGLLRGAGALYGARRGAQPRGEDAYTPYAYSPYSGMEPTTNSNTYQRTEADN